MAVRRRGARKGKVWLSACSSGNHIVHLAVEIPGSRTPQAWPSNPRLPDRLRAAFQAATTAALPMRKIAFKILRQIIFKITGVGRNASSPCARARTRHKPSSEQMPSDRPLVIV